MEQGKYSLYVPEFRTPVEPQRKILGPIVRIITERARNEAELTSILNKVDAVLLTLNTRLIRNVIEACPNLRLIAKYGVGVENIDIHAATEMGIPVTNVPGVNSNAVAELTLGLILAAMRRIQEAKEHLRREGWQDDKFLGHELLDSNIGIIGYGNIARLVIRKLQGFEVKGILVFSESKSQEVPEFSNVEFVDLQTLLKESDIVSIHKTLTPHSRGLTGENPFRMMRSYTYLINTSRGPLIEERALIKALEQRWIAGAALDVFEQEPLRRDSPFLSMDNVVLTPHIGGATIETRRKMVTTVARNIVNILEGREIDPKYIVNPEVFARRRQSKQ
jgi:phosphoglycerate dehydrogenase-like enzyme